VIGHNLHTVVPVAGTGVEVPGWRSEHSDSQREQGRRLCRTGSQREQEMLPWQTGWPLAPETPLEHTDSPREQDWLIGHTGLQGQELDTLRTAVAAVAVAGHTRSVRIHQVRRAVVVADTTVDRSKRDDSDGGVAAAPPWHCSIPRTAGCIRAEIGLDRLE
jgi:hypothetical protein